MKLKWPVFKVVACITYLNTQSKWCRKGYERRLNFVWPLHCLVNQKGEYTHGAR